MSLLFWLPRILGLAVAAFLALFALDAFGPGKSLATAIGDFLIHLVPAAVVVAVVALAWRRDWLGGIAFVGLAAAYAISVNFRPDWTMAVAGPPLLVGLLFFVAWWRRPVT